jgi:putative FmdB family regulatory protein
MPIYAYKCGSCGHAKDVLQKLSDTPLTVCPACGAASFSKQVTAAGFQLKGSGWYATDFKGGSSAAPATADGAGKNGEGAKPADGAAKPAETTAKPAESTSKPAESKSTAAGSDAPKASAGGCGSRCGCH